MLQSHHTVTVNSSSTRHAGACAAERPRVRRHQPGEPETPMTTVRTAIERHEARVSQGCAARVRSTGGGCAHSSTGSRVVRLFTRGGVLSGHLEPEPLTNARREPTPDSDLSFQTLQTTVSSRTTRHSPHVHRRGSTGYFVTPYLESATAPSPRLTRACSGHSVRHASLAHSCR